jgi:hypothetical protein
MHYKATIVKKGNNVITLGGNFLKNIIHINLSNSLVQNKKIHE